MQFIRLHGIYKQQKELIMKTCPVCEKDFADDIEKCPDCSGKLINKNASKAIEVVGDIVEGVLEAVIDGLT